MTDPLAFPSSTPRYALPLLFAGQAQKEFAVNAAHVAADMLLHPAVEGVASEPPPSAAEGSCWIVGAPGTGAFAGHGGQLAGMQAGSWAFAIPRDGLRVLNRDTGQHVLFLGGWRAEVPPPDPQGGSVVDTEARAAVSALISALRETGIFPQS